MIIQICVGSSCHIKGSPEIVELLQQAVAEHGLENDITLAGSFCISFAHCDSSIADTDYSMIEQEGVSLIIKDLSVHFVDLLLSFFFDCSKTGVDGAVQMILDYVTQMESISSSSF